MLLDRLDLHWVMLVQLYSEVALPGVQLEVKRKWEKESITKFHKVEPTTQCKHILEEVRAKRKQT